MGADHFLQDIDTEMNGYRFGLVAVLVLSIVLLVSMSSKSTDFTLRPSEEIQTPESKGVSESIIERNHEQEDRLINQLMDAGEQFGVATSEMVTTLGYPQLREAEYVIGSVEVSLGVHLWYWDEEYTICFPEVKAGELTGSIYHGEAASRANAVKLVRKARIYLFERLRK